MSEPSSPPSYLFTGAGALGGYLGGGMVFYGLGLLGWQIVHWLRFAEWIPLDLFSILTAIPPAGYTPRWAVPDVVGTFPWLSHPGSWLGLHDATTTVLGLLPLPLLLFFGGAAVWITANELEYREDRARRRSVRRSSGYE